MLDRNFYTHSLKKYFSFFNSPRKKKYFIFILNSAHRKKNIFQNCFEYDVKIF